MSQNELNIPIIFDYFQWQYCGGQSGLHLLTVRLPNPHLPTQIYPLIGIFGYFSIVPWIAQHPDVVNFLHDSGLTWTEIQTYQNPVEARSTLQNWQ